MANPVLQITFLDDGSVELRHNGDAAMSENPLPSWREGIEAAKQALERRVKEKLEKAHQAQAEAERFRLLLDGTVSHETMLDLLRKPIDILGLSVRPANCLEHEDIRLIGELVQRTERDLLKINNFGRASLRETREILATKGLPLGMKLDEATRQAILVERANLDD